MDSRLREDDSVMKIQGVTRPSMLGFAFFVVYIIKFSLSHNSAKTNKGEEKRSTPTYNGFAGIARLGYFD